VTTSSKGRLAFGVSALAVFVACGRPMDRGIGGAAALRGANVLLVTIDTLRQDRVGAYGNPNGLTPTIDRLAAHGVRYAHAFSTAPLTLVAHASILTALSPPHHGIHNNTQFRLGVSVPTLATVSKQAGYRTGAFVGAFVLDGRFGLNRGFDEYDDRLPVGDRIAFHGAERRAADVVQRAGDWILHPSAPAGTPWFAWVHLYDPHAPYDAPEEYRPGRAPYDAEVAYTDAMLGRLLARLDAAHMLEHTLIVVMSDHGESLGEHGEATHGLFAYNATLAVPLILSAPSLEPATIEAPVSHVDVMPTILDLIGVPAPSPIDGRSLVQVVPPDRSLYFEALDASLSRGWAPLRGMIQANWKYVDLPEAELYDLAADPRELKNRIGRDPHGDALQRALLQIEDAQVTTAPRADLDPDAAARLRSLGYVGGSSPRGRPGVNDDPKRLVALSEQFNSALTAFDQGRPADALAGFLAILQVRPDFAAARASAAMLLVATGRGRAAVDLLRAGLASAPESPDLLAKLGSALRATGDLHGSAEALEHARRAGDDNVDVLNDLAVVYAGLGRPDDSRALFRQLIDRNPMSATAWFNLGLFELQNHRSLQAVPAFRRATDLNPSYGEAWEALGAALVGSDSRAVADAWIHAERLQPTNYDLLFNLGMTLADSDRPQEALPYLQRFVKEAPRDRYAGDLANVRARIQRLGGHEE
jgi:arylsulfatase A-like enzyme/Flp pilus assembly protein TadD